MTALVDPPFDPPLMAELLALNNAHAEELSYKTPEAFDQLIRAASHVRAEPYGLALIVAFDENCVYDNPNFAWLKARFARFYYIDRVVVAGAARGRGLARAIYAELEDRARYEGRERLVCEINSVPPNPQSDAFHEALGFKSVGSQELAGTGKTVRYWAREFS
ncbi:GNAT family N-acetyltransferase [Aestuariivirga sp.]|uniref:GNAT family N-acetyltransferase n=1 Tax=Aestuariivirga sp. TaxID=2650926 RepID=UPI0035938222